MRVSVCFKVWVSVGALAQFIVIQLEAQCINLCTGEVWLACPDWGQLGPGQLRGGAGPVPDGG